MTTSDGWRKSEELPVPYAIAWRQALRAIENVGTDGRSGIALPWEKVAKTVGPIAPGELWVVGARTGDGKTTFLMNWLGSLVRAGVPWLYIGTETEPGTSRLLWAAWRIGIEPHRVLEREVDDDEASELVADLRYQANEQSHLAHFADTNARHPTPAELNAHIEYAVAQQIPVLVLDHLHRIRYDERANLTRAIGDVVRSLKECAVGHGMIVITAAQLARPQDRAALATLLPPPLSALKSSGTIEEEADGVLLLHRPRRTDATKDEVREVTSGTRPVTDLMMPRTMAVRVGKHRRRGHTLESTHHLTLTEAGKLVEPITWQHAPPSRNGDTTP